MSRVYLFMAVLLFTAAFWRVFRSIWPSIMHGTLPLQEIFLCRFELYSAALFLMASAL